MRRFILAVAVLAGCVGAPPVRVARAQPTATTISIRVPNARIEQLDIFCAEIAVKLSVRNFSRSQCLRSVVMHSMRRARIVRETSLVRKRPRDRDNSLVVAACGDGVLDGHLGEACDDGNLDNDDACSSSCKVVEP